MNRCEWVNLKNPLYVKYHDEEWGRRPKSDRSLYELFILAHGPECDCAKRLNEQPYRENCENLK